MTDNSAVSIADDVLQRLTANLQATQQQADARRAEIAAAVDAGDWGSVCPSDQARCTGQTRDGFPCPANPCPAEKARAEAKRADYLALCGFGERYRRPEKAQLLGRHIDPSVEPIVADLETFWRGIGEHVDHGRGMMLLGPTGTGKTFALACTAMYAKAAGIDEVRFVFAPRLFDLMHDKSPQVDLYRTVPLLLLDDIGVEYAADWVLTRFQALVEHRHAHQLSTCITTNLTWDRLTAVPGYERITSRWSETCGERRWVVGKADLRAR